MNAIVQSARGHLGTTYSHQARLKGVAIDCVGLLISVAREVGAIEPSFNITGYRRLPDGHSLMRHLRELFVEIPQPEMRPGDFICVAYDRHPHHVGVVGDYEHGGLSIVHAASKDGKVVESRLVFTDDMRFVAAFRLPEVA